MSDLRFRRWKKENMMNSYAQIKRQNNFDMEKLLMRILIEIFSLKEI